jgi:hypothetical protein
LQTIKEEAKKDNLQERWKDSIILKTMVCIQISLIILLPTSQIFLKEIIQIIITVILMMVNIICPKML